MAQVANFNYYMEESVLLGTKPLVDSIRHFIRDPSGVYRGYYTVVRRYEFYVRVARTISHE